MKFKNIYWNAKYSSPNNVWHSIKDIQKCRKQENRAHGEENNQPMETDPELTEML